MSTSTATPSEPTADDNCKGCRVTVRLAPGEVERLTADYLRSHPLELLAADTDYDRRMSVCATCPDLRYGTTCRHCGCLVAVRAKLASKGCPAPEAKW